MRPGLKSLAPVLIPCILAASEDSVWKTKPASLWTSDDARQILSYSPWAGRVTPEWVRDLSPDERRQGGDMEADIGRGVGLEGLIGIFDSARADAAIARAHEKPDPGTVMVRWESANAVRQAEQTLPDPEVPALDTDAFYAIVVYDIQTPKSWNERILRGVAALKRYQKKDLKPARVVLERKDDGSATIAYLFPRSAEITKKDVSVIFQAQVGRLVVTRIFSTEEMQIANQLDL